MLGNVGRRAGEGNSLYRVFRNVIVRRCLAWVAYEQEEGV